MDAPFIAIDIEHRGSTSLFEQIYDALRLHIVSGRIRAGERLPPSRSFATELGVSRTTIVSAYDQLIAEGFAEGRTGSGVYVSHIGEVEIENTQASPNHHRGPTSPPTSPLRPFQPGRPDMRLFPHRQWGQCVARVARTDPQALAVQADPFGDPVLRLAITHYLAEWRAMHVSPQQILITAGASDALEICVRTLTQPRDVIALEDPGYPVLRKLIQSLGLKTRWLGVDDHGAQVPSVCSPEHAPILNVLTPSSQFPLGGAMPSARRREFLNWSEKNQSWIIEDDYDSEFRYAGRPFPALASFEGHAHTLYIGSFSKVFSESLRLGFLVMPLHLVPQITTTLSRYGSKASLVAQRPLGMFMQNGSFYRHIRRMRRIYAERRRVLMNMLHVHLEDPRVHWPDCHAGMHITVHLPAECNDVNISVQAAKHGLSCPALSTYCAGTQKRRGILLGFCSFAVDETKDAVPILARIVIKELDSMCNKGKGLTARNRAAVDP